MPACDTHRSGCCHSSSIRWPRRRRDRDRAQAAYDGRQARPAGHDVNEQRVREEEDRRRLRAANLVEHRIEVTLGDSITTWLFSRSDDAADCAIALSDTALGLPGLTRTPITAEAGDNPCSSCSCFATKALPRKLTPVILPPGLFMLATSPNFTGSAPIANTMGMVEVAVLAEPRRSRRR